MTQPGFGSSDRDGSPGSFPSPLAQPSLTPPAPITPSHVSPTPLRAPAPRRSGRSAPILIGAVLVILLIGLVGYFLTFLGTGASLLGAILALIPLAGVLLAIRLVDRWEPEPRSLIVFALAWGAIAAVAISLGVDLFLSLLFGPRDSYAAEVFQTVVQAPVVEEFAKGLGVLILYAIGRRAFDGPVDGIVYGALVGAGFAFTENIQYFAISYLEGGVGEASATFFVRGIMSPFAHVMFTSVTGFALGLAARRGATTGQAIGPWLLGLAGAILLHAFWNGSAVFTDFFSVYLMLQVPLFLVFVIGIIALRREESRLTRNRLGEYAAAGWFTPQEVDMLATPAGRKAGLEWARTLRGDRTPIMKTFIADATALAMARQRAISGRDPHAASDEQALLAKTAAARQALLSL
ncbi:PrsW family intramembrane metalloprotease [Microbacterium sp. BK668]|uniref:PrsW family intramembrane metalloprotease n=1 Tax=Microbacterium sp. BK668 TaxID=2512118 RepID=UPI001060A0AD|nr:PrsW family intramembrane metalloprotease [Microbacterium sp. BK668]TDN88587.1 RsiW-degrading membrane proteinase PrsW (M82 family) [Microbacterium sp. BK668]